MAAVEVTHHGSVAADNAAAPPASNITYLLGTRRIHASPANEALFEFNWHVALYAHRDWLGPWYEPVKQARQCGDVASVGLVQRASRSLLRSYQLESRYARGLPAQDKWVMAPRKSLVVVATQLGIAAMGGVARRMLKREDVNWLTSFMGTEGRQQALEFCQQYPALCLVGNRLPARLDTEYALTVLGMSCLSALLESRTTGVRDRFDMRFGSGARVPLELTSAEQEQARALVHALTAVAAKSEESS